MHRNTLFTILALAVLVCYFCCTCNDESFIIPENIVSSGDFHIQDVGNIADQGSFATDMYKYFDNQY